MKKQVLFILLGISTFLVSCDNGPYNADPSGTPSTSPNPIYQPPGWGDNSSFNWGGTDPMTANIDGSDWQADNSTLVVLSGYYMIGGTKGSGSASQNMTIAIDSASLEVGKVYDMNSTSTKYSASYSSNAGDPAALLSSGLGTGGQIKILELDATHIKALFYFNGKSTSGASGNITKGYLNAHK